MNQREGTIGLWMYPDTGGDVAARELSERLRGAGARVVDGFDMRACFCADGRVLTPAGTDLSDCDVLFHMNFDQQTEYQRKILEAIELSGVRLVNRFQAFRLANDKFLTNLVLRRGGVRVPRAMLVGPHCDRNILNKAFDTFGSMVVKRRFSAGGKGVLRLDSFDQAEEFLAYTMGSEADYYLEQFIPFTDHDYRVEVIGGACEGTYGRALNHRYKTNVSSLPGAQIELVPIAPDPSFVDIGLRAAELIGVEGTGVDLIKNQVDGEFYVIEVNCQPGIFVGSACRSRGVVTPNALWEHISDAPRLDMLAELLLREARTHD